jgi:hypothetical protein
VRPLPNGLLLAVAALFGGGGERAVGGACQ